MMTLEDRTTATPPAPQSWLEQIHELGRDFETRAADHDRDDSFVSENYAALKEQGFFGALVPEELGGRGISHPAMCELLRSLAQYCSSWDPLESTCRHASLSIL